MTSWLTPWTMRLPSSYWPKHKRNPLSDHTIAWSDYSVPLAALFHKENQELGLLSPCSYVNPKSPVSFQQENMKCQHENHTCSLEAMAWGCSTPHWLLLHGQCLPNSHVQKQKGRCCYTSRWAAGRRTYQAGGCSSGAQPRMSETKNTPGNLIELG